MSEQTQLQIIIGIVILLFIVSCEDKQPPVTIPTPTTPVQKVCVKPTGDKYSPAFKDLVCALKESHLRPNLKVIVLAQWIYESGRGHSNLATKHYNFGGLKWRSELSGFGTQVMYEAHDGRTYYVKFATPDAFIQGYWRFIARSPYIGWEKYIDDPEGYIEFIVKAGYCPDDGYVRAVKNLQAEARGLLK